jgi:hypothetical protein
MFNLYFTDWHSSGIPIANGQSVLDRQKEKLLADGRICKSTLDNKSYFDYYYFKVLCDIAEKPCIFCNDFVDNFIFLIDFNVETPTIDLVVDLVDILTSDIISNINSKGFLIFIDNEGYTILPDLLINRAIALGVNVNKIFFIAGAYSEDTKNYTSWDFVEDITYHTYINNKELIPTLKSTYNTIPNKKLLYLINNASIDKVKLFNTLLANDILKDAYYSLLRVDTRCKPLLSNDILARLPIVLDKVSAFDSIHSLDKLNYAADSYLHLLTTPAERDYFDNIYRHNSDLYTACMTRRPFLIANSKQGLKEVARLGYKTFHPFIDESYDSISTLDDKIDAILNLINTIDYSKLIDTTKDITDYNFNHFFRKHRTAHTVVEKLINFMNK